jgi:5,10-methylene-tetrahydrofolate dehydrogenase/methenyl tetrahydrofolate cyclohydrolase
MLIKQQKQYNYQGDSLDLVISVVDREKLKRFIMTKSSDIQKMLSQNKSYDGYMALTSSDIREVIEKLDEDFEVDVIVINYILLHYPLDFEDDFYYLLIEDDEEDN